MLSNAKDDICNSKRKVKTTLENIDKTQAGHAIMKVGNSDTCTKIEQAKMTPVRVKERKNNTCERKSEIKMFLIPQKCIKFKRKR